MIAVEKTPAELFCLVGACPSLFETDRGTYIIVGKELNLKEITQEIKKKIGAGEIGIEVPKALIIDIIKGLL